VASSSSKPKKIRRKRNLTPEQKQAAAERLALAREKRLKDNPPQYKNIHEDVLKLDDDDPWSVKNVKKYIKNQKDYLKRFKQAHRRGEKGAEAKYLSINSYINNMENYLRTGVWLDLFWGEERENKVTSICFAKAYYHRGPKKGLVKRTENVFYPDLGVVYKKEMGDI
jgi:hypothetical protein